MTGLVTMEKDGERIAVSPLCVEDHRRLGWRPVEAEAKPPAVSVETPPLSEPETAPDAPAEEPAARPARKKTR